MSPCQSPPGGASLGGPQGSPVRISSRKSTASRCHYGGNPTIGVSGTDRDPGALHKNRTRACTHEAWAGDPCALELLQDARILSGQTRSLLRKLEHELCVRKANRTRPPLAERFRAQHPCILLVGGAHEVGQARAVACCQPELLPAARADARCRRPAASAFRALFCCRSFVRSGTESRA
eukprot:scaffold79735_cov64-Phaeocystis_antarctica.AAC.2